MYKFFLISIILFVNAFTFKGYSQVSENWEDNIFKTTPAWDGDTAKFLIDSSEKSLKLNAPKETSSAYISTQSTNLLNTTWDFSVYMKYNPSGSNYCDIILASDNKNYLPETKGYFVRIGGSDDKILLYKKDKTNKLLISSDKKYLGTGAVSVKIKVVCDDNGLWTLSADLGSGYNQIGQATDITYNSSQYFGIYCKYTSTRSKSFSFGSISITSENNNTNEFSATKCNVTDCKNISVTFNKNINDKTINLDKIIVKKNNVKPNGFKVSSNILNLTFTDYLPNVNDGIISIEDIESTDGEKIKATELKFSFERIKLVSCITKSEDEIVLSFNKDVNTTNINSFIFKEKNNNLTFSATVVNSKIINLKPSVALEMNKKYELIIEGVEAVQGDIIESVNQTIIFVKNKRADVVITELFVDPTPVVGLPDAEFIELYNRSNHDINLENYELTVNNKSIKLTDYPLKTNSYVIIAKTSSKELWDKTISVLFVDNMPSLPNSGAKIILRDADGQMSNAVRYPLGIKNGGFKTQGGWSMEKIDVNNISTNYNNWDYSLNLNGGTPGAENSIKDNNPDLTLPNIDYIAFVSPKSFKIGFDKTMDFNNIEKNITVDEAQIKDVVTDSDFSNSVIINFTEDLKQDRLYDLKFIKPLTDIIGNKLLQNSIKIGVPMPIDSAKVLISEVLFNPIPEGTDFVEIYNKSSHVINQSDLYISSFKGGKPQKLIQIDTKNKLFFPNDYIVITKDSAALNYQNYFIPNTKVSICSVPSLNDDDGNVAINLKNGKVIDYFEYNKAMHFELLRDKEGVSLERISFTAPASNPNNWHSASATTGYSTPGKRNSQSQKNNMISQENYISLQAKEFSPNSDGNEDYLQINYNFPNPGWVCTLAVYNRYGQLVKTLVDNKLMDNNGFVIWDGTNEINSKVSAGIYIIYYNVFSEKGNTKEGKLISVVTMGNRK